MGMRRRAQRLTLSWRRCSYIFAPLAVRGSSLYPVVLFVHSWLRWIVLAFALLTFFRSAQGFFSRRTWEARDRRMGDALVRLADLQFTLGLLLYLWLSPIVRSAFADMGAAMRSAPLRFFAVEHITAMVLAVSLLHVGHVRTRRASDDRRRHRNTMLGSLAFVLMVLIGMPWPILAHGRPLARTTLLENRVTPAPGQASSLYASRCASCHGPAGQGDGIAAAAMDPPPRNFADRAWQASISDAELARVISQGGLARQLSASMPPHPDLRSPQLQELVRFIRAVPAQGN
jgi:mono/diheme cytochrome c family protein/uncharacterized membrane protein YozB (DUF420 family)